MSLLLYNDIFYLYFRFRSKCWYSELQEEAISCKLSKLRIFIFLMFSNASVSNHIIRARDCLQSAKISLLVHVCQWYLSAYSAIWVFMSTKWDVYDVPLNDDICCFSSLSRIFHSQGEVTIAGEGLQTLTYMYTRQHWAVRALSHATPTVTRGISF